MLLHVVFLLGFADAAIDARNKGVIQIGIELEGSVGLAFQKLLIACKILVCLHLKILFSLKNQNGLLQIFQEAGNSINCYPATVGTSLNTYKQQKFL